MARPGAANAALTARRRDLASGRISEETEGIGSVSDAPYIAIIQHALMHWCSSHVSGRRERERKREGEAVARAAGVLPKTIAEILEPR